MQYSETADADSLNLLLSAYLNDAKEQQDRRQQKRKIIGRIGKQTVTFATNFSSFLQAYSGIIEIMNGADQQYGGVAYSALSLLLIVSYSFRLSSSSTDLRRSL